MCHLFVESPHNQCAFLLKSALKVFLVFTLDTRLLEGLQDELSEGD